MKSAKIREAWSCWKKESPGNYAAFKSYRASLKDKMHEINEHEITGLLGINGEIDEFELSQYLADTEAPIPVDNYIRRHSNQI